MGNLRDRIFSVYSGFDDDVFGIVYFDGSGGSEAEGVFRIMRTGGCRRIPVGAGDAVGFDQDVACLVNVNGRATDVFDDVLFDADVAVTGDKGGGAGRKFRRDARWK
jgi:hypothetical protein